ncbi:MAG: carbon-phosphorus lyase complex subunit PhnI [Desulfotignum sp.]|nr:carbon-phosphorus lyase complex subunit PhnI [Desulfotignum sp.]
MYVAVKGGEKAVKHSQRLVAKKRRGDTRVPEISPDQIKHQLGLGVDRVMAEGSLYDETAAAMAIQQAQGDLTEAVFLVRAFRTTLKRFGTSRAVDTTEMTAFRRVSGIYKDIPGGQILGPTYDYTHRLIETGAAPATSGDPSRQSPDQTIPPLPDKLPRVMDILKKQGLIPDDPSVPSSETGEDLTRQPLTFPVSRPLRLQALARGDEGFLLGSAYSLQRGFGLDRHPFLGELKVGYATVCFTPPELGFEIRIGRIRLTECVMVSRQDDADSKAAGFDTGYGLVFGQNERKAMSMSLLDRSLSASSETADAAAGKAAYPAQDPEFILSHCDSVESSGFVQHLKLPHYVDFQSELVFIRNCGTHPSPGKGDR